MMSNVRGFFIRFDPKEFAVETGVSFRGATVSEGPVGFRVIFRGRLRDSTPVYAMAEHEEVERGFAMLYSVLCGRGGSDYWHRDKYAPAKS